MEECDENQIIITNAAIIGSIMFVFNGPVQGDMLPVIAPRVCAVIHGFYLCCTAQSNHT